MIALVLAALGAFGIPWGWLLSVAVGGFIGLAVYQSRQDPLDYSGSSAGCFVTIAAGIIGAVLGEFILDQIFDVQISDFIWVIFTAVIGASIMVMLVAWLFGRRRA